MHTNGIRTALVTGATGFTGNALCERLRRDGAEVTALVRTSSDCSNLEAIGVNCVQCDITSRDSVSESFRDVQAVFHIAAAYRSEHADHLEFERVNVDATRHLLDESLARQIPRFVHCSTVGVQGEIEDPPADEDYRFNPGDHYQESKLKGELLALEYVDRGLAVSVVRPVGIYGPGDTRFLKLFRPISKGMFVMIGTGESLYHMTFIDDLVEGFILAATRDEAVGEAFTIGGANYTTLNVLADKVAHAVGKKRKRWRVPLTPVLWLAHVCDVTFRAAGLSPPIYPRRVEFFVLDRAFSIEKARRLLEYEPKVSLDDGLQRTAEWYKSEGLI